MLRGEGDQFRYLLCEFAILFRLVFIQPSPKNEYLPILADDNRMDHAGRHDKA